MNNYIQTGRLVGDRRGRRGRNAEKQEAGTQKAWLGNGAHLARHTLRAQPRRTRQNVQKPHYLPRKNRDYGMNRGGQGEDTGRDWPLHRSQLAPYAVHIHSG